MLTNIQDLNFKGEGIILIKILRNLSTCYKLLPTLIIIHENKSFRNLKIYINDLICLGFKNYNRMNQLTIMLPYYTYYSQINFLKLNSSPIFALLKIKGA